MSFPKWIENIVNETGKVAPTLKHAENIRQVVNALEIAWEALEEIADENYSSPGGVVYDSKEAMRRIEELGD